MSTGLFQRASEALSLSREAGEIVFAGQIVGVLADLLSVRAERHMIAHRPTALSPRRTDDRHNAGSDQVRKLWPSTYHGSQIRIRSATMGRSQFPSAACAAFCAAPARGFAVPRRIVASFESLIANVPPGRGSLFCA